jgi:hypothetical protein
MKAVGFDVLKKVRGKHSDDFLSSNFYVDGHGYHSLAIMAVSGFFVF